jgi:teichuronic acid biosynthesis glycosyltransferase TuaC
MAGQQSSLFPIRMQMKVLVISTMFPNNIQPVFGIFVQQRIQRLARHCELKIVSPIPYFPLVGALKRYAYRAKVKLRLNQANLEVYYPRFFSIPMILKPLDAVFIFLSLAVFCYRMRKEFDFDLIDAHLAYPDGFAAVLLGKLFKKPVIVTLRGHDIFELPKYPIRRRQVVYALKQADRVLSVADALKQGAIRLGVPEEKIDLATNGVDTELFHPMDKLKAREELGLPQEKKIILSIGHLVVRKGFHHIIKAISLLSRQGRAGLYLVIVGAAGIEGDYKPQLDKLIKELQVDDMVCFAGSKPYHELYRWYGAADIFCLASNKEGWANVLLEALACGKPVVASRAWGTSEVITSEELGVLVEPENPSALASGLETALQKKWDYNLIIDYAKHHSWEKTAAGVYNKWQGVLGEYKRKS